MKKTDGFTLIELLVGILCATIITGAAMSLLLMGARTNHSLFDANTEQQTARIITTMVDSLASEGGITKVYVENEDDKSLLNYGDFDWAVFGESSTPILSYSYSDQTIYSNEDTVLMDGVISSSLTLSRNSLDGCLFGLSIQTDDGHYETSTYCRTFDIESEGIVLDKNNVKAEDSVANPDVTLSPEFMDDAANTSEARFEFLKVLCTQYGSRGQIMAPYRGTYFSEWYLVQNTGIGYTGNPGWNADTPQCACFLTWGLSQISEKVNSFPFEADVDRWKNYFVTLKTDGLEYEPSAGDIIFFDWADNGINRLEHIGAVFYVDETYVYTIEGNNSDSVELNRYRRDSDDIVGYGVLNWKTNNQLNP